MASTHWPTNETTLSLVGPSVLEWANGLFSNNVQDLLIGGWQRNAMLDERGRVQGLMSLGRTAGSTLVLVLEGQSFEDFEERYRMHALLDDVEIEALDWHVHTVQGAIPDLTAFRNSGGHVVPRKLSLQGGVDLLGASDWIAAVIGDTPITPPDVREQLRIQAGIPVWPVDFSSKNLSHEMRMRDDYLAFDKGCYVGQETVMRVDVRGQVRKELRGIQLMSEPQDADVYCNARKVGALTSSVAHPKLGWIGLAVLKDEAAVGATVQLGQVHGTVVLLPFEG